LKYQIPELSRSNLHLCLKRNGLNVLQKEGVVREKKKFKEYPSCICVHLHHITPHIATEMQLFAGIDRATKYVYAELHTKVSANESATFLKNLINHCHFKISKILTDNDTQFKEIQRIPRFIVRTFKS